MQMVFQFLRSQVGNPTLSADARKTDAFGINPGLHYNFGINLKVGNNFGIGADYCPGVFYNRRWTEVSADSDDWNIMNQTTVHVTNSTVLFSLMYSW